MKTFFKVTVSAFAAIFVVGIFFSFMTMSSVPVDTFIDEIPAQADEEHCSVISSVHRIYGFEMIYQLPELPTGCEMTSLTMALRYVGLDADKTELASDYLEKAEVVYNDEEKKLYGPDFRYVFPGDPADDESSFGCFPPCVKSVAENYIYDAKADITVTDLTGTSFYELFKYIESDIPVIIWSTQNLEAPIYRTSWITEDDKEVTWPSNEHCIVLSGYDLVSNTVEIHDPLEGVVTLNMEKVKMRYDQMGKNALILEREK